MSYPLINGAAINADSSQEAGIPGVSLCSSGESRAILHFAVEGSLVLAFGALNPSIGEDVDLYLPGLSLVQSPYHSAVAPQPPANTSFAVSGSRVLAFGDWRAEPGAVIGQSDGSIALGIGELNPVPVGFSSGSLALGLGELSATRVGWSSSSLALGLGSLSVEVSVDVPGMSLCRSGTSSFSIPGQIGVSEGSLAIGFGTLEVSYVFRVGQSLALGLGATRVERDGEC
ncbi:MAG: hypothetical protein LBE58_13075 [Comamonas sp.]|jgi:hypothetical protein|nr:hypothetical protein [Comamonas sp.]